MSTDPPGDPRCYRTRRAPGIKLGSTKSMPCQGTIRDDPDGPSCTHCRYRYSHEEVAAIRKAAARRVTRPKRLSAEQMSMLADVV